MPQSVLQDFYGADWPLGFIAVAVVGTPVGIMSLVDPNSYNDPVTPTNSLLPAQGQVRSPTCNSMLIQACRIPAGGHGLDVPTGNVYLLRKPQGAGSGNRDDYGAMVLMLTPGESAIHLASASPYKYFVDADNVGDGALITLFSGD